MGNRFESVQAVRDGLKEVNYLADDGIASVAFLADRLGKPVLIEGPAGTGKTQLAKSITELTGARLIRLQCYEGLDESARKPFGVAPAKFSAILWENVYSVCQKSQRLSANSYSAALLSCMPEVFRSARSGSRIAMKITTMAMGMATEYKSVIPSPRTRRTSLRSGSARFFICLGA